MKFFTIILILFAVSIAQAQSITVFGNAKTYSGDTLRLFVYSDFITKTKTTVTEAIVEQNGDFSFSVSAPARSTIQLRINLQVFEGVLYAEHGTSYQISLPQKTEIRQEDALNPYFKPQEFYINVLNASEHDINTNLRRYEKMYASMIPELFEGYSGRVNSAKADAAISAVQDSFELFENKFLKDYIYYDLAHLRFLGYKRNKQKLFESYFSENEVVFENPAYNRAVFEIFGNFLFEQKTLKLDTQIRKQVEIETLVNQVAETLKTRNTTVAEFVLLVNLHERFYIDNFLKADILSYLRKNISNIKNIENKHIAQNFILTASKLMVGNPVPDFTLKAHNETSMFVSSFRGKFLYLNFFNPDSYSCMQDLSLLKSLYDKNTDLLEIVTVWTGGSYDDMLKFRTQNACNWTFLYADKNAQIFSDYKVVSFPTYYLIHPEGTLQILPAPRPGSDQFEPMYFYHYREWKRELIRKAQNNPTNNKSIINN